MDLKKFKGREVEVQTLAATGYRTTGGLKTEAGSTREVENVEDNVITGLARDCSADSITVEYTYRLRKWSIEIPVHAVAYIATFEPTEASVEAANRLRERHAQKNA